MSPHTDTAARPPSARLWPWVPALLLGGLLGTQLIVLVPALDDPGFAIEPDYYRKATAWDAEQASLRQSRELGWHSELDVTLGAPGRGQTITLKLYDRAGEPLRGAQVSLRAFHNARAGRVFDVALTEVASGVYAGKSDGARPGLWELRVQAQRGADVYRETLRRELVPERGTP